MLPTVYCSREHCAYSMGELEIPGLTGYPCMKTEALPNQIQESIFRAENGIYPPPPSENDIFPPSRDTSFFDSHFDLLP
jgi:hypothetical protein